MLFGVAGNGLAGEGARPDQYQIVDPHLIQKQTTRLKKPKITLQDLNALSAQVHTVDVSGISVDVLPAPDRPKGPVQLDRVLIIEPSK